jgi:hypothetical protein
MKAPISITTNYFSFNERKILSTMLNTEESSSWIFWKKYEITLRIEYVDLEGKTNAFTITGSGDSGSFKQNLREIEGIKKMIDEKMSSFNKEEQSWKQ